MVMLWALFSSPTLSGQPTYQTYHAGDAKHHYDLTVEATDGYIRFAIKGADGGVAREYNWPGGQGATLSGAVAIGSGQGQIPSGSTIRLIPGQAGASYEQAGGGGGGSAVAFKRPGSDLGWELLFVAGAGGGAGITAEDVSGDPASENPEKTYTSELYRYDSGGGGGADKVAPGSSCSGQQGFQLSFPVGKTSSCPTDEAAGGFGFGSGGNGGSHDYIEHNRVITIYSGGGGGGYLGGRGGVGGGQGSGGSSYVNSTYVLYAQRRAHSTTNSPLDGYVTYEFTDVPSDAFHFNKDINRCIDVDHAYTANGTNIKLDECKDHPAQFWQINDSYIQMAKDPAKCLSLEDAHAGDLTNIHLWDCKGVKHQRWIYDVWTQSIRSGADYNKCLDVVNGNTSPGTNLQLKSCPLASATPNSDQQWVVPNVRSSFSTSSKRSLRLVQHPDKCLDLEGGEPSNGINIRIKDCQKGLSQYVSFWERQIKFTVGFNVCVSVKDSETANGTNVLLWQCRDPEKQNQQWIYDGCDRVIRSMLNPDKCLSIADSAAPNGTNVHLWDCQPGSANQQFEIY